MLQAPKRVAVVDDDESVCRALDRLLRASGYASSSFHSAEEFLEESAETRVDCLLLDVHLGGMSGLELHRLLLERKSEVPVIFISAHENADALGPARDSGYVAFFNKPVPGGILLDAIRQATGEATGKNPEY